jgi:class 3 adenylate cyclase
LLVGEITKEKDIARKATKNDYILLTFGFLANISKEPFSFYFALTALYQFTKVITAFNKMFTRAMNPKGNSKFEPLSLQIARMATVISWAACINHTNIVPTIYFLTKFRIISYSNGEMCFCIADIGSKVFITLVLVNATVEQSQNEKYEALTTVASEMQTDLTNADALLGRMMPEEVLNQLKNGNAPAAEEYDSVTIFFSDITDFTVLSSKTTTQEMLKTLNMLWEQYDKIARVHGMYKVETIGDAYLGVTGCPKRSTDHAIRAVEFAIDIIAMVKEFKTAMGSSLAIRIGLNSGPITAGVLGEQNPHWCVVGDTVNTASRMESTSKPYEIHISESTFNQIKSCNRFRIRGPDIMQVKGKGELVTFWVDGRI